MIPISCANTATPSPVFSSNMPLGLMMQGTPTGFIPLCMGEPVLHPSGQGFMYNVGSGEPGQESARTPRASARQTQARPQFELPNCLAVNSCMTHQEQEATKKSGVKKPQSGEGSRNTTNKVESGSALASNASPGEPAKVITSVDPSNVSPKQQTKQIGEELCSSSQSLYSFLHSSDENDISDFLIADSSKLDDSDGEEKRSVRQVARPILCEPFWNEGVVISETLMKTYQMEELDMEAVLKSDLERLEKMKQSEVINCQLKVRRKQMTHLQLTE